MTSPSLKSPNEIAVDVSDEVGDGADTRSRVASDGAATADRSPTLHTASEVLFIDPIVDDIAVLLGGLRPEVTAIILDSERPAARQMAITLASRGNLDAIHVIAHGAPGKVSFAAGEWSTDALAETPEDFAAIGRAVRPRGSLRLWSCRTGAGAPGEAFVNRLAMATGVAVAASSGLVGAQARGGGWDLDLTVMAPPLTAPALDEYAGLLVGVRRIVSGDVPYDHADNVRYVVVSSKEKRVVAGFWLPGNAKTFPKFSISVIVPNATETYEVGRIDEDGKFTPVDCLISEASAFVGPNHWGTHHGA